MAGSVFQVLQDATSEDPIALTRKQTGDNDNGNGLLAFGFRDSAGNVILPQLDASNRLPVTLEAAGTLLGNDAGTGSANVPSKNTDVVIAKITLAADKTYNLVGIGGSSFAAGDWRLELISDALGSPTVESTLYRFKTGAGDNNFAADPDCPDFVTTSMTGVIELQLIAQRLLGPAQSFVGQVCILDKA